MRGLKSFHEIYLPNDLKSSAVKKFYEIEQVRKKKQL